MARADVWYASAFTQGSLPWNLQTLLSWKSAKELLTHSFERRQKGKVFLRLRAARLSSPCVNVGAQRSAMGNYLVQQHSMPWQNSTSLKPTTNNQHHITSAPSPFRSKSRASSIPIHSERSAITPPSCVQWSVRTKPLRSKHGFSKSNAG
jgi:hypothetical protein